jgi:regulator of replication initiation timing
MSTDPNLSTDNQDLPTEPNNVITEAANNAASASYTEDNSDDLSRAGQDNTPEEIARDLHLSDSTRNEEPENEEKLDNSHHALDYQEILSQDNLISTSRIDFTDPQLFKKAVEKFKAESERLSKNNDQLEMKMDKILEENNQLRQHLTEVVEENNRLSSEVESLNERLAKLEESAKFKFDALIQEALKQDDAVWDEDSEECQKYIEQAKLWHSKTDALYTSVSTAISDCVNRIDECGDLMQEINKENLTLYKSLLDRHKSLELSKRMLERLREPIELLKKASLPLEQLLRLQKQELVDLLRSQTEEAEAKKILAEKVKETGDTRYKSIREWRDLAEKSQKQWLNFIEKKLLFAFDGISDGKPYAQHLVDELRPSYQTSTCQKKLDDWLQTYLDLENILLEALKNLDITPMSVEIGKPVDYNLHEPIATEPDPNLDHESVKEVTRNGYEYKLPDQEQPLILRSAQVIVVKNK